MLKIYLSVDPHIFIRETVSAVSKIILKEEIIIHTTIRSACFILKNKLPSFLFKTGIVFLNHTSFRKRKISGETITIIQPIIISNAVYEILGITEITTPNISFNIQFKVIFICHEKGSLASLILPENR